MEGEMPKQTEFSLDDERKAADKGKTPKKPKKPEGVQIRIQEEIMEPTPQDEHHRLKETYGEGADRTFLTRGQKRAVSKAERTKIKEALQRIHEKLQKDVGRLEKETADYLRKRQGT